MTIMQERLKELLSYDPLTGIFLWRVKRANKFPGDIAGCNKNRNYTVVYVEGRFYRAHRLAWFYMTGEWPSTFLDHRDMNKHNNVWTNLRLATKSQNQANIGLTKSNSSGLKGVSRYRQGEKWGKPWQSAITKDGKSHHVGHFATKEEAHAAYCETAERLFGEFARAA